MKTRKTVEFMLGMAGVEVVDMKWFVGEGWVVTVANVNSVVAARQPVEDILNQYGIEVYIKF